MIELKNFVRKINEAIYLILFGTESIYTLDSGFYHLTWYEEIEIEEEIEQRI